MRRYRIGKLKKQNLKKKRIKQNERIKKNFGRKQQKRKKKKDQIRIKVRKIRKF
jgi:hypothetical protein